MKKPQPIHTILEQTLKGLELDVPLKTYSIWTAWKEIVGEAIALQTQPRAIRNHILFIDVSHSTWMQQLQLLKPKLLEKINAFLGEPHIQDIRFKLGKISQPPPTFSKTQDWRSEELDRKTLKQIESYLQKIEDEEGRKGLRDVLIKGAKLEQSRRKLR
ncbi:MAG: DciA family protein [Candidatus Zixiibacteriota bacterium]